MVYIQGNWYIGNRKVTFADVEFRDDVYPRASELLTHLSNWDDTNDLGIYIENSFNENDDAIWKIKGPITNILLFVYNWLLDYKDYTITDILKDKDFDINIDIYLKNVR